VLGQAERYLRGLVQAGRKNMERMVEAVPDTDYQRRLHFLTDSPWDHRAVMQQVASEADRLLGGHPDTCLLLDESSFVKKGNSSAGVARQWCGRLGKVENCQSLPQRRRGSGSSLR
jgi:SRSO17 transposase